MQEIIEINDINAPELDVYARLTQAQLTKMRSPEGGLFIAESLKVIGHALDAGYQPVSLLMEREKISGQAGDIIERCGVPVYTAPDEVLRTLTGFALTRGILCAMRRPEERDASVLCEAARRVAVIENVTDPTNVGAIFRSAAALGVQAVLITPSCCDPLHRRAVRVSMGAVFQVPWARIGQSPSDWPAGGLRMLRELNFKTAALALSDTAVSIEDAALNAQERLAVILGTEGDGLMRQTVELSDYTVRIPMTNGVDSLNVAAASAVAFWQLRVR